MFVVGWWLLLSKFITELEALRLVAAIQNFTPVDTGALRASVQVGYIKENQMMVIVGANSTSGNMAHRKHSPSQYVRYVNEGYPKGSKNELVNKGFVERGVKAWAEGIKTGYNQTPDYNLE